MSIPRANVLGSFTFMLFLTVSAAAAPSVSSTSGTFGHGQSVTISGSNFGTKATAAPVVWDDCSTGTYPSDNGKWSGYWPNVGTTAYRLQYTAPIRSIGLPHNHITRYLAGCHGSTGADAGYNVMMWKSRTISSYPAYTYASWYHRIDNNWVFGDDNFKTYDFSGDSAPWGGTDMSHNWYLELTGFTSKTTTPYWHFNDDGSSLQNPDVNNHSWWWTPAVNPAAGAWAKVEIYLKITNQSDGFIKLWENGSLRVDYLGSTDKYPGTARSDSIGGYARPNGQPNNYRYFADCYLDYTPARVVLANNANLNNATIVENLIPTAWSDTSITATVNLGKFQSGAAYVFVVDSTGAVNPNGYAVSINDGPPTVTIAATTATAYESGQIPGIFTVTRTGATTNALAVNYAVSGTAANGTDYAPALSGTVTIPAGSASATITVTPVDQKIVGGSKTVILAVSANANYTVGSPGSATVTILYNDSFQPGDTEGDCKVDGIDLATLSQNWDPLGTSGTHTWAQGDFNGDGRIDGIDLAALCQNWNPLGYSTVTISATTPTAYEQGQIPGVVTVTRVGDLSNALAVNFTVSGTAVNGTDYAPALSGNVTIPAGSASATISVTPVDLGIIGGSKTVILTLGGDGYIIGSPGIATVTIVENDSAASVVLVDFGSSAAGNTYGLTGWATPTLGRYSHYSSAGPAGVTASWSGNGHDAGVKGTSRTFAVGEQVIVTWYNTGTSALTFTPKISLNDSQDYTLGSGPWYNMTALTLAAGATGTTTYTINSTTASNHSLVNVCRVLDGGDALLLDKIELHTVGASSPSVMTLSAPAPASTNQQPAKPNKTSPPARRLVPWPSIKPATAGR